MTITAADYLRLLDLAHGWGDGSSFHKSLAGGGVLPDSLAICIHCRSGDRRQKPSEYIHPAGDVRDDEICERCWEAL